MRDLGVITDKQKIINIMKESSEEVRIEAIKYFTATLNEDVIPEVIKMLPQASNDLIHVIVQYMKKIQPKNFSFLLNLLQPYKVKQEAIATLFDIAAIIKDKNSYNFVLKFTSCSDEYLRERAFRVLVSFGYKRNEKLFEKALLDPSRAVRAIVLAHAGPDSDSNFLNRAKMLAKDPDEDVRLALALAIGSTGLPEFKPLIMEMIDDPSPRVEAGSFIALACFNDPEFLNAFYNHANISFIRSEIKSICMDDRFKTVVKEITARARKLKNLEVAFIFANNDREFANYLVKRLKESLDPIMRMQAIEILKLIAIPEIFTAVLSVMKKDPYADVRIQAMDIVVSIGREEEIIAALSALLADPEQNVRNRAVMLLGKYKNPKALESLLQVLDTADREFRDSVTTALSHLLSGDPGYIARLVESVPETKTRKIGMAWLMGKSRKRGSIDFLVKLLSDDDPDVRASAVGALGKFKNKQLINTLEKLIYDPNERVRAATINAVVAIGGDRAFEIVNAALHDIDDFVRTRAVIGLAKINLKMAISMIRSKLNKFPEFKSYLKGLLFAAGEPYNDIGEMDVLAINVVDEVCDKDKMNSIYKQSLDREKRLHAFRVLSLNNNLESYTFMKAALKDPLPEIREEAKKALSAY
jgi:HEAT repeat protein